MAGKNKSQAEKAVAKAKSKAGNHKGKETTTEEIKERVFPLRLISSVIFLAIFIVFLVICFDPSGAVPAALESIIHGLMGRAAFVISIPASLYLFIIHAFSGKRPVTMRTICIGVFILLCGCLSHFILAPTGLSSGLKLVSDLYAGGVDGTTGGVFCGLLAMALLWLFGKAISYIILIVAAVFTLLGAMHITIPSIIRAIKNRPRDEQEEEEEEQEPAAVLVNHLANKHIQHKEKKRNEKAAREQAAQAENSTSNTDQIIRQLEVDTDTPVVGPAPTATKAAAPAISSFDSQEMPDTMPELILDDEEIPEAAPGVEKKPKKAKVTAEEALEAADEVAKEIESGQAVEQPAYCFPPIDLLQYPNGVAADGMSEMQENSRRLKRALVNLKIEANIINVTRGPSITRYEVALEEGMRLNKLTNAAEDIALRLGASSVRIETIPKKESVVGIEVPNEAVTTVSLREVIDSPSFWDEKSKSSFALGKDIGGNCIIGNIAKLPHMLIAGTTGSGKSVCMNSIIISLLYKASPEDVKLIMVDPKMVEMIVYDGIPHLLIPVVTDPKKAAGALQWATTEMMRRYAMMSSNGVRELSAYNKLVTREEGKGDKLPQIVIVIDELADLMLVASKEVEESICRIAQMGRAAGVHLLIATQRPSADVITGLMKANIPSRVAFSVASAMESRIILDNPGAEKLVGRGDMLFAPVGSGKPKRVQGCFVSDEEVEAVAAYVKSHATAAYDQQVIHEIELTTQKTDTSGKNAAEANEEELMGDELLPDAVNVILEIGQASVSLLQRRLKLGYARAARIVDEMEELGIVGPHQGSKPRDILITKEQWQTMRSGKTEQLDFDDYCDQEDPYDEVDSDEQENI